MTDSEARWGPMMAELTEKQRQYVLAMASEPLGNPTQWARMAGYADDGEHSKPQIRVTGHRLSHDPKIKAAIGECARSTLDSIGPMLGIAVMLKIARDPEHRDQLKAAAMLANRTGFHELHEQLVHVQHTDRTGAAMIARITELAGELGLDAAKLLGANAPQMKVIEHDRDGVHAAATADAGGGARVATPGDGGGAEGSRGVFSENTEGTGEQ